MRKDDGFADQGTDLGPADVEYIRVTRDEGQIGITLLLRRGGILKIRRRQAVAQTRPVQEKRKVISAAYFINAAQLAAGVQGSIFGGMGDVHHSRMDHVLVGVIREEVAYEPLDVLRTDLAVLLRDIQNLMAGIFNGACLVNAHVSGGGRHYALPGLQERVDHQLIGLGASGQEGDLRLAHAARFPDLLSCGSGKRIRAVSGHLLSVGRNETLQDLFKGAFGIITFKSQHI